MLYRRTGMSFVSLLYNKSFIMRTSFKHVRRMIDIICGCYLNNLVVVIVASVKV